MGILYGFIGNENMYIRFVVAQLDKMSNKRQGVFQAAFRLRDAGELYHYERNELKTLEE